jgi:hypothetical protein
MDFILMIVDWEVEAWRWEGWRSGGSPTRWKPAFRDGQDGHVLDPNLHRFLAL